MKPFSKNLCSQEGRKIVGNLQEIIIEPKLERNVLVSTGDLTGGPGPQL